jgi:hypothetical protein
MSKAHQPDWLWTLAGEHAERIDAAPQARWLVVRDGEVWLTRTLARGQAEDLWLAAGQAQRLPPGSAWVVQGWPQARVELVLERTRAPRFSGRSAWAWWASSWRRGGPSAWRPA